MNKKIKIGILSMMIMGISLSASLPIVSCSQNEEQPIVKQPLTVIKADEPVFNDLALLFAKVGNPEQQVLTNLITQPQFNKILNEEFVKTSHPAVWSKASEAFILKLWDEEVLVPFDDAAAKINVTGTYDNKTDNLVTLEIKVQLKPEYAGDERLLTEVLTIGTNVEAIAIARGNANALDALGHEFVKLINPSVLNNKWIMKKAQYDEIIGKSYSSTDNPEIWGKLVNYFSFYDSGGQPIAFNRIVKGITVTGTFPTSGVININLKLIINEEYKVIGKLDQEIQVGVVSLLLTPSKGGFNLLSALGTALTKVGNQNANDNLQGLAISHYNQIINKTYTQTSYPAVWNALVSYYTFTNPFGGVMPFNEVVDKVTVTGAYSQVGVVNVLVNLTLKPDYYANDSAILSQIVQVGTAMISVSLSKGNQEALNTLGMQFAKVGRPEVNNNKASLLPQQYNTIVTTTYTKASHPSVWQALSSYFTFINSSLENESFDTIVANIEVSGTFAMGEPTSINVKLNLKPNVFFTSDENTLNTIIQVGVGSTLFTTTKGNDTLLNNLGKEFARIGNPSVNNNNSVISIAQLEIITSTNYNDPYAHGSLWRAMIDYFIFRDSKNQRISFTNAVGRVSARQNPPSSNDRTITITLHLKNEYYTNDTGALSQFVKVGIR
ncbi:MAG: hypothetical protein ACRCVI_01095 [Mycoplasmoidaceae bacterium]